MAIGLCGKAPRDLFFVYIYTFIECYAMFNLFSVLMWILIDDCRFSDAQAGLIYGAFSFSVSVFGVGLGLAVDKLLVQRSLFIQCFMVLVGSAIMAASLHPVAVCVSLFVLFAPALSMQHTALSVSMMRYTTKHYRNQTFAVHYVLMNLGAVASSFTVDAFRLWIPRDELPLPLWSLFMACNGGLHVLSLLLIMFGIRDVEVVDDTATMEDDMGTPGRWPLQPQRNSTQYKTVRELVRKIRDIMSQPLFWRYVLVSTSLVGARSVLVYLFTLYPVYMRRAPFPVPDPAAMPFMMYTLIDPLIVIVLAWIVSAVVQRARWPVFWVIVVGTVIGAGAPFWMMITQYWAVFAFIVTLAIAESIWSPLYLSYITFFTTKGDEGMFFGLTGMTTTVAKMTTSVGSGLLLQHFCSAAGQCAQGYLIWLIAGCAALTTPILLIVLMKWTWLRHEAPDHIKLNSEEEESTEQEEEYEDAFALEEVIKDIHENVCEKEGVPLPE